MKVTINQQEYEAPENLSVFKLFKHESSNIDIVGTNHAAAYSEILVQFNSGKVFVYRDCTEDQLAKAEKPDSFQMPDGSPMTIGKFVANYLVRKQPSQNISDKPLIIGLFQGEVMLKEDVFDGKGKIAGLKNDVISIIVDNGNTLIVEGVKKNRYSVSAEKVLRKVTK